MHRRGDGLSEHGSGWSVCIVEGIVYLHSVCIGWDVFTGERTEDVSLHRGGDMAMYRENGIGSCSQSRGQK